MWCRRTQLMPSEATRAAARSACSRLGKQASKQKFVAQNRMGPRSLTNCPSAARMNPSFPAGQGSQPETLATVLAAS